MNTLSPNVANSPDLVLIRRFQTVAQVIAAAVFILGWLVLLPGWAFDIDALKTLYPGMVSMKANTALCFMLLGAALWLLHRGPRAGYGARASAGVVALVGLLTLAEYLGGWSFGIDTLLFPDAAVAVPYPGRMSPATAYCFLLSGLALLLPDGSTRTAQFSILLSLMVSYLALVGYLYNTQALYQAMPYSSMALHTAVAFIALDIGVLLVRPADGWMASFTNHGPHGDVARRLVPAAVLIPVLAGAMPMAGERTGLWGADFGVALMVVISAAAFLGLIGWTAKALYETDRARRRVESALRESQTRKAAILDAALDCFITMDRDGKIVDFNPAAEKSFGYTTAEAIGGSMAELIIPARLREQHRRGLSHYLATGEGAILGKRIEMPAMRTDGSEFPIELAINAIQVDGRPLFTASLRDITARKQSEQEIRKLNTELELRVAQRTAELNSANKELEAFSYSVSHDLRSPLRAINGFSQVLLEDYSEQLDDNGRGYLDRVQDAVQRMETLIDALLSLSRVGRAELERQEMNLSAMAEDIIEELQATDPQRHVEITIARDVDGYGDPRLIQILLSNLLNNAWKYTGKCAHPKIAFGSCDVDGQPAYFVRDNGAGFDMANVGGLFSAFRRLHHARDYPGTGIGLATAQRIIGRHGGRVWAEAEVAKGAVFYFTLPDIKEETHAIQTVSAGEVQAR